MVKIIKNINDKNIKDIWALYIFILKILSYKIYYN